MSESFEEELGALIARHMGKTSKEDMLTALELKTQALDDGDLDDDEDEDAEEGEGEGEED